MRNAQIEDLAKDNYTIICTKVHTAKMSIFNVILISIYIH